MINVTTVTIPTPYSPYPNLSMPILSHQNHFRAPNAKPKPSGSIPSQLASNVSPNLLTPSRLSNALPNTPTPLHLVDAFPIRCSFNLFLSLTSSRFLTPTLIPTRCSFDLSSSSHQVDSRHPHPFLTRHLSTFTPLRQVYSWRFIGLATAVGRSPIAYLPCLMCLSLSFLALYISVRSSMSHHSLPFICFLCLILSSPSPLTLVSSIFIPYLRQSSLVIPYIPYDPFPIVQINPILTTPTLV